MKKLRLKMEIIRSLALVTRAAQATNSSECKWCSCEQHCEQVSP